MKEHDQESTRETPLETLGVSAEATDEEIRAAYLRKVKEYPPDRAPAEFERVRDAYEALRDPRKRAQAMMMSADPMMPLTALLDDREPPRRFVGPGPWLSALREA